MTEALISAEPQGKEPPDNLSRCLSETTAWRLRLAVAPINSLGFFSQLDEMIVASQLRAQRVFDNQEALQGLAHDLSESFLLLGNGLHPHNLPKPATIDIHDRDSTFQIVPSLSFVSKKGTLNDGALYFGHPFGDLYGVDIKAVRQVLASDSALSDVLRKLIIDGNAHYALKTMATHKAYHGVDLQRDIQPILRMRDPVTAAKVLLYISAENHQMDSDDRQRLGWNTVGAVNHFTKEQDPNITPELAVGHVVTCPGTADQKRQQAGHILKAIQSVHALPYGEFGRTRHLDLAMPEHLGGLVSAALTDTVYLRHETNQAELELFTAKLYQIIAKNEPDIMPSPDEMYNLLRSANVSFAEFMDTLVGTWVTDTRTRWVKTKERAPFDKRPVTDTIQIAQITPATLLDDVVYAKSEKSAQDSLPSHYAEFGEKRQKFNVRGSLNLIRTHVLSQLGYTERIPDVDYVDYRFKDNERTQSMLEIYTAYQYYLAYQRPEFREIAIRKAQEYLAAAGDKPAQRADFLKAIEDTTAYVNGLLRSVKDQLIALSPTTRTKGPSFDVGKATTMALLYALVDQGKILPDDLPAYVKLIQHEIGVNMSDVLAIKADPDTE